VEPAVPSPVTNRTLTVCEAAGTSDTLKVMLAAPESPSAIEASAIDRVGPVAAEERNELLAVFQWVAR
jgi:hypothetical protein